MGNYGSGQRAPSSDLPAAASLLLLLLLQLLLLLLLAAAAAAAEVMLQGDIKTFFESNRQVMSRPLRIERPSLLLLFYFHLFT